MRYNDLLHEMVNLAQKNSVYSFWVISKLSLFQVVNAESGGCLYIVYVYAFLGEQFAWHIMYAAPVMSPAVTNLSPGYVAGNSVILTLFLSNLTD